MKLLPLHEQREVLRKLEKAVEQKSLEDARANFMPFVKRMWPTFVEGRHHRRMAEIFDAIKRGEIKRACINLPPRHTKSKFCSTYFPADYFGNFPHRKVMQLGNTQELVSGFGREVRDIVDSEEYQRVHPGVRVSQDSRAADRWNTIQGGEYLARGIGGKITGKGADLLIIDDAHSEQEAALAAFNPTVFDGAYEWYMAGPRQRLQPGAAIMVVMTRWGKRDLQGRILQDAITNGSIDEWKLFEFPAILPSGDPLWPEYWPIEELLAVKRDLPPGRWLAQYQQTPTTDSGNIIKKEWWRHWEGYRLPEFSYIIQSWDTAFSEKTSADFSACTTWGVFYHREGPKPGELYRGDRPRVPNVMLLDSWRDRVEFPELKSKVRQQMAEWSPQTIVVEERSSGEPLIADLRAMGIPMEGYKPSRGNSKLERLNAVADIFKSGFVWVRPGKMNEYTIEEFADYPSGNNDDLMDSGTQALLRLRDGMLIGTANDDFQIFEDDDEPRRSRPRLY